MFSYIQASPTKPCMHSLLFHTCHILQLSLLDSITLTFNETIQNRYQNMSTISKNPLNWPSNRQLKELIAILLLISVSYSVLSSDKIINLVQCTFYWQIFFFPAFDSILQRNMPAWSLVLQNILCLWLRILWCTSKVHCLLIQQTELQLSVHKNRVFRIIWP